ncbi:response regulator [Roseitalea porphyridii]|uniref:Response regulator n=1 Tax=Roseitalea porphyridii TaxID=1852022 RepID=A0A4P6V439_9HYPH|nr:response regulator [Roseitalea porphyridii]
MRILIVEDEALVALDLATQMEDLGHEVVGPAHSVEQAMPLAEGEALDFALLDINLRGRQSTPVAQALIARGIPLVFLSGYDSPQMVEDLGAVRVLPKPVQPRTLGQLLSEVA